LNPKERFSQSTKEALKLPKPPSEGERGTGNVKREERNVKRGVKIKK